MLVKIISALVLVTALVLMCSISKSFYIGFKCSQYMGCTKYYVKKIAPLAIVSVMINIAVIISSVVLLCG